MLNSPRILELPNAHSIQTANTTNLIADRFDCAGGFVLEHGIQNMSLTCQVSLYCAAPVLGFDRFLSDTSMPATLTTWKSTST